MVFSLRSLSSSRWKCRSSSVVHDAENRVEISKLEEEEEGRIRASTSLTVWRKSLLFTCNGFTVIDCNGSLAYRVDNYIGRPGEVVLMDGYGNSVLTVRRRKNLSLVDEWLIYEGEASTDTLQSLTRRHPSSSSSTNKQMKQKKQKPVYYVKKHLSILQANSNNNNEASHVLAHVYMVGSKAGDQDSHSCKRSHLAYVIEGSYTKRSCRVLDCRNGWKRKTLVAEIKIKEAINGCASFGLEVFDLIVWSGFDPAFAMTLVLLLDQMFT